MKKTYIIPEIQIYDADAENLLAGTTSQKPDIEGPNVPGFGGEGEGEGGFTCQARRLLLRQLRIRLRLRLLTI